MSLSSPARYWPHFLVTVCFLFSFPFLSPSIYGVGPSSPSSREVLNSGMISQNIPRTLATVTASVKDKGPTSETLTLPYLLHAAKEKLLLSSLI